MTTRSKDRRAAGGKKPPPAKGPVPGSKPKHIKRRIHRDEGDCNFKQVEANRRKKRTNKKKDDTASGNTKTNNCRSSNQNGSAPDTKKKKCNSRSNNKYNHNNVRPLLRTPSAKIKDILPKVDPKNPLVVSWWIGKARELGREQRATEQRKQEGVTPFNALQINALSLAHLNQELEAFAEYVRLTDAECRTREFLIHKIKMSCKDLFGVAEDQCQVFGSFAAKSVCTFESDIDLAIWGVVPPDKEDDENVQRDTQKVSSNLLSNELRSVMSGSKDIHGGLSEKKADAKVHPNQKKQERILRWKKLLDDYESELGPKEAQGRTVKTEKGDKETEDTIETTNGFKNATQLASPNSKGGVGAPYCELDRVCITALSMAESDAMLASVATLENACSTDDGDENHASNCQPDCDDDSADKLDSWRSRSYGIPLDKAIDQSSIADFAHSSASMDRLGPEPADCLCDQGDDDNEEEDGNDEEIDEHIYDTYKPRPRGHSLVSLSSATTCSEGDRLNDSGMEVSYMVDATASSTVTPGPSGQAKTRVINALYRLTRPLGPYATNLHVRKRARVPIINMVTHFGYECDIAVGGHNGTDTSSYASAQVSRFKSFSILIVVLKIILSQQGLDKPFTGGLGSYSLYVLVANHLERHLSLGGSDTPAEALLWFFFRYGGFKEQHSVYAKIPSSSRTCLDQNDIVRTMDGGSADLKSCFQLRKCITVFRSCFSELLGKVTGKWDRSTSMLQYIINAPNLDLGRRKSSTLAIAKMSQISDIVKPPSYPRFHSEARLPKERKASHYSSTSLSHFEEENANQEAETLVASYRQSSSYFLPGKQNLPLKSRPKSFKKRNTNKRNNDGSMVVKNTGSKPKRRRTV